MLEKFLGSSLVPTVSSITCLPLDEETLGSSVETPVECITDGLQNGKKSKHVS